MNTLSEHVMYNNQLIILSTDVVHNNTKKTVIYRYNCWSQYCEVLVYFGKNAVTMSYLFCAGLDYIARYGKDTDKPARLRSHIKNLRAIWTNSLFDQIFMKTNLKKRFGLLSVLVNGV